MGPSIISFLNTARPEEFRGLRRNFKSWLRPKFGLGDKTKTDSIQTETDETQTEKSVQIVWVGFESYFHPLESFKSSPGWAQTPPGPTHGQPCC